MALAMGVQNAAAQRLAVPELTTTVLTRTLTGLASEAGLAGGAGSKLGRRAVAVAAMLLGALTGGLLVLHVAIAAALAAGRRDRAGGRARRARRLAPGCTLDPGLSGRSPRASRRAALHCQIAADSGRPMR